MLLLLAAMSLVEADVLPAQVHDSLLAANVTTVQTNVEALQAADGLHDRGDERLAPAGWRRCD